MIITTSKNRGPASLLGSDSGDANALSSAPKNLIDPTFCSKHAHVQVYPHAVQKTRQNEHCARGEGGKKEACAMAHVCRRDAFAIYPICCGLHDSVLCCQRGYTREWSYGRRFCPAPASVPALGDSRSGLSQAHRGCREKDTACAQVSETGQAENTHAERHVDLNRCAHASQFQPLWHSTQTTTNRGNCEG